MAALRGPDSSEDERRLGEQAVFPETVDVNIRQLDPIPAPRAFLREQPLTDEMSELVLHSRQEIRDVLNGRDDRLLVIVGPCSIHDPKAAHEYAEKLAAVKRELEDRLVIVMRVYFEKPRTTIGWKGLINDPDIDGSHNIRKGLLLARKTLLGVLKEGLAAATEFLEPTSPQFISDAVSWGAIGARNTESQIHRQLASGLSMPVGFKNATDGSVKAAVNGCFASALTIWGVPAQSRPLATRTAMWCCAARFTARTTMPNPCVKLWKTSRFPKRPARASMASSSMPPTATAAKTKTAKPKSSKRSLSAWRTANKASPA